MVSMPWPRASLRPAATAPAPAVEPPRHVVARSGETGRLAVEERPDDRLPVEVGVDDLLLQGVVHRPERTPRAPRQTARFLSAGVALRAAPTAPSGSATASSGGSGPEPRGRRRRRS